MINSIGTLRRALGAGHADHDARVMAQRAASFSGAMRSRLEYMLDALEIPQRLRTTSAAVLLTDGEMIQTTSCVRYPTFRRIGSRNWNGRQPLLLEHNRLRAYVFEVLAAEVVALPDALVVPLGNVAGEAVNALVAAGLLQRDRCCIGVPHPSPANASMEATFRRNRQRLAAQVVRHFA